MDLYDRSVDSHISRLRCKLEPDPKQPTLIKTIRGKGYMFSAPIEGGGGPTKAQAEPSSSRRTTRANSSIE